MEYSLVLRDSTGDELTIMNASYVDNILNMSVNLPVPKKPWWYQLKDSITPLILSALLFRQYRQ